MIKHKWAAEICALLFCFWAAVLVLEGQGAAGETEPAGPPQAASEKTTPASVEKVHTGQKITFEFQNADIHEAIKIIAEAAGKKVIISDAVSGKISVKLKKIPWDQALDIVLPRLNLGYSESGDVLTVYDLTAQKFRPHGNYVQSADRDPQIPPTPRLAKKVFTPKHAPINLVTEELAKRKSERGKILAIGNDIYVEDEAGAMETMNQVFMRVDKAVRQILLEVIIIDCTSAFAESLAENPSLSVSQDSQPIFLFAAGDKASVKIDDLTGPDGPVSLSLQHLNNVNTSLLNANLNVLEVNSGCGTVSAPRIMAANDREVSVKPGTSRPHCFSCSTTDTRANVQFKESLMELKLKPHIEETGDLVTLDISLINDGLRFEDSCDSLFGIREVKSRVVINDGQTVLINGLIINDKDNDPANESVTSRLPLFRWLYRPDKIPADKAEKLIFITARIVPIDI